MSVTDILFKQYCKSKGVFDRMTKERSEAQVKAEKTYGDKRKSLPRLPSAYLDDEQNALLNRVSVHYKTKKDAIIEGLKLLEKKHQSNKK